MGRDPSRRCRMPSLARRCSTVRGATPSATSRRSSSECGSLPPSPADQLLRAGRRLGMPTLALVSTAADALFTDSTSVARIVLPDAGDASLGTMLPASAVALQLLTLELLTIQDRNPDLIGREKVD